MNGRTFSQNPRMRGKSHHHHHHYCISFFFTCSMLHAIMFHSGWTPARQAFVRLFICFVEWNTGCNKYARANVHFKKKIKK